VSFDPGAFDAFEAAGWASKEVSAYDTLAGRVTSRLADHLLDAVEAGAGASLLDVATGPGYVAERAVARGAAVVGLDLSEAMLEFARARVAEAEFVHGDATALPFEDSSFTAVTAAFVLLHLGRPERAVADAVRVLRPGGSVAFTVWDVPARARWLGLLLDAVADVGAAVPAAIPSGPPLFRFADDVEFARLLSNAGLEDATVETIDFSLRVESAEELWRGLVEGTVRVRPLVIAQSDEVQHAIRVRFEELLEEHRDGDGFEVPVAVKLGSGRKP
jgi:ubiquinone/menaquinone biosynthesis C-methylase UbiE